MLVQRKLMEAECALYHYYAEDNERSFLELGQEVKASTRLFRIIHRIKKLNEIYRSWRVCNVNGRCVGWPEEKEKK